MGSLETAGASHPEKKQHCLPQYPQSWFLQNYQGAMPYPSVQEADAGKPLTSMPGWSGLYEFQTS